ncbi:MAG: HAD hydrolase-like protein, partial [Clostridia bacterium]|nr:HAD hydrolase-like protein [Clostridia bacterium]
MAKYDYVIFDFDGTVVDTGEGILKSLQYSFKE